MRNLTMSAAINEALQEELLRNERLLVIGEDVGRFNGAFQVTKGLLDKFGPDRIRDTPISEGAIIGCAIGASLRGWPTIAEMQYSDFVACGFDQIVNQAAKMHLASGGQANVPLVLRLPIGAKDHGVHHDQSPEAWFMHTPGLKVVIPSTAYDAKGLLKTAIRDPNPVVFCEHKVLYTILNSIMKTSRAIIVTEETRTASCAAEISAMISEEAFDYLDAPVIRMGMMDTPIPFPPHIQQAMMPSVEDIVKNSESIMEGKA